MTRTRTAPKDAHLPLIGYREIEAGKIELARAIFAVADDEGRSAMQVLDKLNRFKLADEPLPYLAVREDAAEDGSCRRVIVVRHNLAHARVEESTELDAGDLTTEDLKDPEKRPPAASLALEEYAEDRRFRRQVMDAPRDIRISTVVLMYLKLRDPANMSPGAKELREYEARRHGETSPWTGFVNATNFGTQLIGYLKNMTVGQITATLGQNYKDHLQGKPRMRGGTDEEGRTVALPKDATVDAHLSLLNVALAWFVREYRAAVRVEFDKPVVDRGDPICLTWEEVRRAIMFCLGYVWDGVGYATERVFRDGKWQVVLVRRPLAEYEMYLPVVRFLLIYFLTGTRFKAILKLGWVPLNFRGWIDLDRGWIYRNGRKSKRHAAKPKEQSQLLPVVRLLFANWFAHDERSRIADKWAIRPSRRRKRARGTEDVEEKGFFVVHDGSGNPVPLKRMQELITEVFAKVGIDATGHKLKGGGVTTYHDAGFSLAQISFWFGTTERVLDTRYRKLKQAEATFGIRPAPPDPARITLSQLLDPHGRLGPVPRSAPHPEAVIDMLAEKAGARRACRARR
ncbi:MAG: hypothetical protein GY844_11475 [Bradyrhizobium sp.]|nr:hypothetical protein [Bradyrhizobium sp.]